MAYPSTGHTDPSVYFIRRAIELLGRKGAAGLIVTNSVSQGDNRDAGLAWAVGKGATISTRPTAACRGRARRRSR